MFEDLVIDTKNLQVRLALAALARFEPLSGIMVLNIVDRDFDAMVDAVRNDEEHYLLEVFNHEMYHCFQTYCTGYIFHRACLMRDVLGTHFGGQWTRVFLGRYLKRKLITWSTIWLPPRYRDRIRTKHALSAASDEYMELTVLSGTNKQSRKIGAYFPDLYRKLADLKKETLRPGKQGLSAIDVIESGATVYANIASQGVRCPNTTQLLERLSGLDETYTRALRLTYDLCGERALSVLLPATALSLRYENPGNAYVSMVQRIAVAAEGKEVAEAKELAKALPSIEDAGRLLGTAVEARAKIRRPTSIYEQQMQALKTQSWGIDELDLLSDPQAISSIPYGLLGFGILTQDSNRGLEGERGRLVIADIMLRGGPAVSSELREIRESLGLYGVVQ